MSQFALPDIEAELSRRGLMAPKPVSLPFPAPFRREEIEAEIIRRGMAASSSDPSKPIASRTGTRRWTPPSAPSGPQVAYPMPGDIPPDMPVVPGSVALGSPIKSAQQMELERTSAVKMKAEQAALDRAASQNAGVMGRAFAGAAVAADSAGKEFLAGWGNIGSAVADGHDPVAIALGNYPKRFDPAEMPGMSPEAAATYGGVASEAGAVSQFISALPALPMTLAEPKSLAAMLIIHRPVGGALSSGYVTNGLRAIEQRFGPNMADLVRSQISEVTQGAAFGVVHGGLAGKDLDEIVEESTSMAAVGSLFAAPGSVGPAMRLAGQGVGRVGDAVAAGARTAFDAAERAAVNIELARTKPVVSDVDPAYGLHPTVSSVVESYEPVRSDLVPLDKPEPLESRATFGQLEQIALDDQAMLQNPTPEAFTDGVPLEAPNYLTPDQAAEFAARNTREAHAVDPDGFQAELDLQRGNIESLDHRGKFVLRDVPVERFQIVNEPDAALAQEYAGMSGEKVPPIIAGPVARGAEALPAGKELLVTDGKHRLTAALARGEKTIQALVPEHYAQTLDAAQKPAQPQKKPKAAPAQQAVLDPLRAYLEKNPNASIREAAKATGSNFGTTRRAMLRLKSEQASSSVPEKQGQIPDEADVTPSPIEGGKPEVGGGRKNLDPLPNWGILSTPNGDFFDRPGAEPVPLTPEEAKAWKAAEIKRRLGDRAGAHADRRQVWNSVIERTGLRAESEAYTGRVEEHVRKNSGAAPTDGAPTAGEGPKTALPPPAEAVEPLSQDRLAEAESQVRKLAGSSPEAIRELGDYLSMLDDDELSHLQTKFNKGATARAIKAEVLGRETGKGGEAGSPVLAPDTVPGTSKVPAKAQASVMRNGRSLGAPDSPHRMIARLARRLGMSVPGFAGARALKKLYSGFYRGSPESVRLRMADDMDTFIHEASHHLHKMVFQGGLTLADVNPRTGKRISATGLDQSKFPGVWRDELDSMGRALYGSHKPAGGYKAEGWAELVRNIFTGNLDATYDVGGKQVKVRDMVAYKDTMSMLQRDWPEVLGSLEEFRGAYQTYRAGTPTEKLASYIRRDTKPEGPGVLALWDKMRTALFDRMQPLVRMKKDLGLDNLPADEDPHLVALRAFGRATGDMEAAMQNGTFDPKDPTKITGPALNEILAPVRHNLTQFDEYLTARRVLEKRQQGYKGLLPEMTDGQIADAMVELENLFPEFKKAAVGFQKFNRWLIRDYAVGHGLLTPEVAQKIIDKNLEYVTFRRVLTEDQGAPGSSTGAPNRYVETGTGVRRFPRDTHGVQIEPPIEAFMASMQGIMHRAQMNRVGQTIVEMFQTNADFKTMDRARLEMVAEENGIDPALPRDDIVKALNDAGIREVKVEGIGRWIDKIDRPLDATKLRGTEVRAELEKRLKAIGIDPEAVEDSTIDAILALSEQDDFMSFRPGFRVDKKTRQFSVLVNGKPTFWEAKNTNLFRFLEGFENPHALQGFWKLLSLPRRVYRAGATALNPSFFIINYLRDLVQAMAMSDVDKSGGLTGLSERTKGRLRGMWKAFSTGDPGAEFRRSGALMSGLFGEYIDPRTKQFKLDRMFEKPKLFQLRGHTAGAKAIDFMTTAPLWRFLGRLNERFELMNRLGEFESQLAQSDVTRAMDMFGTKKPTADEIKQARAARRRADIERAGQAAADITLDFSRGGVEAQRINKFIPFFNAAFLGGDKLARYIRRDPWGAIGRIFSYIIAPSIVAHYTNREDEDYWELPYEQRDRYWHFGLGDVYGDGVNRYVRIPKPYGLGVFSVATDRALAYLDGRDPVSGKRGDPGALRGVADAATDSFRPPIFVPILTPAMELYFNHAIFTGSEIVRAGERTGPAGEQGAERSSEMARMLGGFMDVPPPQIDHAIEGLFAGLGREVVDMAIDPALRTIREDALGYEPRPTRRDKPSLAVYPLVPVIKRLIVEEPKTYSETMLRFWNTFNEVERIYRGWSSRKNDADRYERYYDDHAGSIEAYKNLIGYKTVLDKLFQELTATYRDLEVPADEREKRTRALIREITETAREGMNDLGASKEP